MSRKIIDFIQSPTGKFIIFFLLVIIAALTFNYYKNLPEVEKKKTSAFNDTVSIEREYVRFRDEYEQLQTDQKAIKTELEQEVEKTKDQNDGLAKRLLELEKALAEERALRALESLKEKEVIPPPKEKKVSFKISPVSLFSSKPVQNKETKAILKDYAPYGRLIKCQLVNTVDSSSVETPIIAIVIEDVWHDGKVIIPAGTEIHGKANSVTLRNRISTDRSWVLVWRTKSKENGFELPLTGLALDYNRDIKTGRFHITDGSAGLRGFVIETDEYAKLKLYASLFLKGATQGVTDLLLEEARSQDQNTFVNSTQNNSEKSSQNKNQIKIGMASGVKEVTDLYAKQMLDAITRDGVFVRVPAGTSFYLYIMQTIDKSKAVPGATSGLKEKPPETIQQNDELKEAQRLMLTLAKKRLNEEENKSKEINEK